MSRGFGLQGEIVKNWRETVVHGQASLRQAMESLDRSRAQICVVTDPSGRVLGTVTDGDIRRGFLAGLTLQDSVQDVMNRNPILRRRDDTTGTTYALCRRLGARHLPVVDGEGRLVGLEKLDRAELDNWVVIMAGGLGTRLGPLTRNTPKPLLNVGDKPILETIIESARASGLRKFYISVNYLSEQIKAYFGDGSAWGVTIEYLEETEPLGTAGSLGLIPQVPSDPILVVNGDLLTSASFDRILRYNQDHQADATVSVRELTVNLHYGTMQLDGNIVSGIVEKPSYTFVVNAAIYALSPVAFRFVPKGRRLDMPELIARMRQENLRVVAYPLREYWIDIGQPQDLRKANQDYALVFKEGA